jgi:hypothetical protein
MVCADSREAVEHAHASYLRKWRLRSTATISSFEEASDELFTFLQFPQSQWKALAIRTHSTASTGNFADAPRPRPHCQMRTLCCCCSTASAQRSDRSAAHRWGKRYAEAQISPEIGVTSNQADTIKRELPELSQSFFYHLTDTTTPRLSHHCGKYRSGKLGSETSNADSVDARFWGERNEG